MIARSHEPPISHTVYTGKVYNWTAGSDTPAILLATQLLPPNNCVSAVAIGCVPSYMVSNVQVSVDVETAAGKTRAARLTLDRVAIGNLTERAVPALVVPRGQMKTNLLGMSFLDRLESWEVRPEKLLLRGYP